MNSGKSMIRFGGFLAFCGAALALFRFGIDTTLQYQVAMPLFYWEDLFLAPLLRKPGGVLVVGGAFIEQFFTFPWTGVFIATALFGAVWALTAWLMRLLVEKQPEEQTLSFRPAEALVGLPACLGLVAASQYGLDWVLEAMGVALALTGVGVVRGLFERKRWAGWTGFGVLCASIMAGAGGWVAILFAVTAVIAEWVASRQWRRALVLAVMGAGIIVAVEGLYRAASAGLAENWTFAFPHRYALAMVVSIPALVGLGAIRFQRQVRRKKGANAKTPPKTSFAWQWVSFATGVVLTVAAVGFGFSRLDRAMTPQIQLDWAVEHEDWSEALVVARRIPNPSWNGRLNILRSLYHKGRLLDGLFDYPQTKDLGLLPDQAGAMVSAPAYSATLLELGHFNLAEHFAHEGLEMFGDRPDLVKTAVKIRILKNQPAAASVYLEMLRKNPVHRAWADDYLARLKKDPALTDDPEIARLRTCRVKTDYYSAFEPTTVLLEQALGSNRTNRMAFEYAIANSLLNQDVRSVYKRLGGFPAPAPLPRAVEEALLDVQIDQASPLDLGGRAFQEDTKQRLAQFRKDLSINHNLGAEALIRAVRQHRNTYWHYCVFGMTPGADSLE
jgi:hypothetical protein